MYPKRVFLSVICPTLFLSASVSAKEYTLDDLVLLTRAYDEEIKPTNTDYFDPDFSDYYASQRPNFFTKIARSLGFMSDKLPIDYLINALKNVTMAAKSRGQMGNFILGCQVALHDKIIIIGSIQGAFHSLVRDLKELLHQGVIDNNLKIIDPRHRIIFNGTAVARSPYILQTLFVIIVLMQKNPDQVFYLKSDFEKERLWLDRGFARQLHILYKKYASQVISAFTDFIDVMPEAFYVNYFEHPETLCKITALHALEKDTIEHQTGNFFHTLSHNQMSVWHLDKKEKTEKNVRTSVLIEGFFPTILLNNLEPLSFLEPVGSATKWRVFSAPTSSFATLYGFKSDAFATVTFGKELSSSIIELYSRNRFAHDDFKLRGTFDINTGITPRTASKEHLATVNDKIYIGSSLDLSKSNFIMGARVLAGISLAIHQVNESGGINNKDVQPIIFDDEYTPYMARDNIARLKNEFGVSTVLLPIGTPTILAAEDLIKAGDILVAFPITGSPELRQPSFKGAINFRPSFEVEVEILVNYLINESKFKTFGFFYQDDEYGQGCMKKAKEVLKKNNIKKWIEIPYARNTTNFDRQREVLKNEQIEALGCFSASFATQEFLRQVGAVSLAPVKVFALAFVVDDVFESFVKNELGLTCLFSRVVPHPTLSPVQIVQEYRMLMDEMKKPYDVFSLEAYIATTLLCELMKKTSGDSNHDKLIAQFEALNNYNFKGLPLTFDPADRQISKRVWLDFQDGNDWKEVLL